MSKIKLYTFLDKDEKIIEEVRAENHDQAIRMVTNKKVDWSTDFYSEEID